MGYRLDARLRRLEQCRKQKQGGVIIVRLSGKLYVDDRTGERVDISKFAVTIVNDIPRGNSG